MEQEDASLSKYNMIGFGICVWHTNPTPDARLFVNTFPLFKRAYNFEAFLE